LFSPAGLSARFVTEDALRTTLLAMASLLAFQAAASAQDPFGQADPFEGRFKEKSTFQIKFKTPEAGGEIHLSAREQSGEKDVYWEASGDVVLEYQDVKITADRARYVFPTDVATLEGHVVIDQGATRMAGDRGTFRLKAKTGRLENASADLAPTYHIVGEAIEKIGEATYRLEKSVFTSCELPHPAWSFYLSEAIITVDDYAHAKNVSFRLGPVPLLYTPRLVWPTKEDRTSGLLVPAVGFTRDRGAYLGLTHFWVTGRPTDLTTRVDLYSGGSYGVGEELRWAPALESAGVFEGYAIHDKVATVCVPLVEEPSGGSGPCTMPDGSPGVFTQRVKNRWKFRLEHVSDDLPWGMRGVVSLHDYSDQLFLQDIERSFTLNSATQIASTAFLSKNSGNDSFNLRFERTETFFGTTVRQERLPSLEYFRRTSRIGDTPLYFAAEGSLSFLYVNRGPNLPRGDYERADLHPTISLPWKRIPWLSVTATAGGRWTGYTDSTDDGQTHFLGSSFTRQYGEAGVSIVGPSFSRIFDGTLGPFGKFKHVIEPRVDYQYISDVDDPLRIPAYDDVDLQLGRNQIRYAIVNRLLARPADPSKGSAIEIASLQVSQTYAFELPQTGLADTTLQPLTTKRGPVEGVLRLAPSNAFHVEGSIDYDTQASQVTSNSLSVSYFWKTNAVAATWFSSRPILATPLPAGAPSINSDQLRLTAGADISKAIRLDTQINYDAQQHLVLEDRSLLAYKGSCFTVFLEVRQLRVPPTPRRDFRLVFNLKDIGTLLDMRQSIDRLLGQ
jgi:LPS-assembly protein